MKLRHRKRYIVTDPHDSGGFGLPASTWANTQTGTCSSSRRRKIVAIGYLTPSFRCTCGSTPRLLTGKFRRKPRSGSRRTRRWQRRRRSEPQEGNMPSRITPHEVLVLDTLTKSPKPG